MLARQALFAHVPGGRRRVLAAVLLAHLALGWWLVRVTDRQTPEVRQRPLDPVVIQQVRVAPPEPVRASDAPTPAPPQSPALQATPAPHRPPADVVPAPQPAPTPAPSPTPTPTPTPARLPAAQTADGPKVPPAIAPPLPLPALVPAQAAAQPGTMAPRTASAGAAVQASTPAPIAAMQTPAPAKAEAGAGTALPTAASPAVAPAVSTDIAVVCPTQLAPVMPRLAIRAGQSGVVLAQALVVGGKVREVRFLSGPSIFHNAVRAAMLQYRCVSNAAEVQVTQEFRFELQ